MHNMTKYGHLDEDILLCVINYEEYTSKSLYTLELKTKTKLKSQLVGCYFTKFTNLDLYILLYEGIEGNEHCTVT